MLNGNRYLEAVKTVRPIERVILSTSGGSTLEQMHNMHQMMLNTDATWFVLLNFRRRGATYGNREGRYK